MQYTLYHTRASYIVSHMCNIHWSTHVHHKLYHTCTWHIETHKYIIYWNAHAQYTLYHTRFICVSHMYILSWSTHIYHSMKQAHMRSIHRITHTHHTLHHTCTSYSEEHMTFTPQENLYARVLLVHNLTWPLCIHISLYSCDTRICVCMSAYIYVCVR